MVTVPYRLAEMGTETQAQARAAMMAMQTLPTVVQTANLETANQHRAETALSLQLLSYATMVTPSTATDVRAVAYPN